MAEPSHRSGFRQTPPRPSCPSPPNQPYEASFYWPLLFICLVGLALRVWNLIQTSVVPTAYSLAGDSAGYFDWAARIAAGDWIGDVPFYQAPLYPYVLAILMDGFGAEIVGVRFVQAFFGAASVGLIGLASRPLLGPTGGLLAAAMLALYGPAIYYDGIIQKTSLASLLLCGMLASLAYLDRRHGWVPAAAAGVLLGLLTLTRENALLWIPLPLLWIAFGLRELPVKQRAYRAAAYGGGILLVLFPVAARNAYVGGEWSPTTFQSGPNFYIGNNLDSNGIYQPLVPGHETPMYERADAQRLAEQAENRRLSSREVSSFWMKLAVEDIRSAPLRWAELMGIKVLMVINRYEIPDVESLEVYRLYSTPLKVLGCFWHFGVLCPLGLMGIACTWQHRHQFWLSYLLIASMVAAVALFFVLGRYRYPLVPLLIPFAASAMLAAWAAARQRRLGSLKLPLLIGLSGAVICNLPIHDRRTLEASSMMNQGAAAGQAGRLEDSIRWLSKAIELQPELPEAYFNLGRALALRGSYAEAVAAFREAQRQEPGLAMVDFQLGDALEKLGDHQAALRHYRRAAELDPADRRVTAAIARLATD